MLILMEDNKTITRVGILAVIIAILFGILSYIPKDAKYEVLGFEFILFVMARISFLTILFAVFVYLILLAMQYTYSNVGRRCEKWASVFYDITAIIIFIALFIVVGFTLIGNIMNFYPSFFQSHIWIGGISTLFVMVIGLIGGFILLGKIKIFIYQNPIKSQ